MTKNQIIEKLKLSPLGCEGGWFFETYRSETPFDKKSLPPSFKAQKYVAGTSIYFLLSAGDTSKMHSVAADETWHFHAASDSGVYISLVVVSPDGEGKLVKLGADLSRGRVPQFTVPAGWAMGARVACDGRDDFSLVSSGAWTLSGATVCPSFEFVDFVREDAREVASRCPSLADEILKIG